MMTTTMAKNEGEGKQTEEGKKEKETHSSHKNKSKNFSTSYSTLTHSLTRMPCDGIFFFSYLHRIFSTSGLFSVSCERATAIDLKQQYMIDYNMPCEVFYERQFDVSALRLSGIVRQFGCNVGEIGGS